MTAYTCYHLINGLCPLVISQKKTEAGRYGKQTNKKKTPDAYSHSSVRALSVSGLLAYLAAEMCIHVLILPECGPVTVIWI